MSDHEWCRDVRRDEAVRAAEDAAAVPSIQHRDLPEAVADLRERVARLEAAARADRDWDALSTLIISERDAARTECARLLGRVAELEADRDAAIRERDAARAECERLRACADPFGEELAVIAAWERCAITADWPADEPETAVRCAASMEREILRLRARVAELEAAQPPRGWLTAEERAAIRDIAASHDGWSNDDQPLKVIDALLARETPPRVKVPDAKNRNTVTGQTLVCVSCWNECRMACIAAIRAAGGEVEG